MSKAKWETMFATFLCRDLIYGAECTRYMDISAGVCMCVRILFSSGWVLRN